MKKMLILLLPFAAVASVLKPSQWEWKLHSDERAAVFFWNAGDFNRDNVTNAVWHYETTNVTVYTATTNLTLRIDRRQMKVWENWQRSLRENE